MTEKRRCLRKKAAVLFLAGIVVIAALTGWRSASGSREENAREPAAASRLVSEQLVSLQQLVTVKYQYTGMGRFENVREFYGYPVPFTAKSFLITYEGEILAGVDLEQSACSANGDVLTVTLPKARITSHAIHEDTMQVYDESASLFNPIHVSDYTAFCAQEKEKNETNALAAGLLEQAEERAAQAVCGILRPALPMLREIAVVFAKTEQPA